MHTMLANRSDFSIGESILSTEDICAEAKRVGEKTVTLVDTMSVTGLIEFSRAAKKNDLKPIIGCRLRLVDNPAWRKTKEDKKAPPEFFVTWYVLSEKGLQALYKLLTLASSKDHFYNVPKLSFDDLFAALDTVSADDVAVATGDSLSVVAHVDAAKIVSKIAAAVRASNCFVTLTPIDTPYWDTINAKAIDLGRRLQLPFITTRPTLYKVGDADNAEVMGAISRNVKVNEMWHWSNHARDISALSKVDMLKAVTAAAVRLRDRGFIDAGLAFKQGLVNTDHLADLVSYEWVKQAPSLPVMAPVEIDAVIAACRVGWSKRFGQEVFGHKPTLVELKENYAPRLAYELKILKQLGFAGYFLLVQDVVDFAKRSGILVGPGRGSVGGSLVAYLMGITDCDPLRFGLLFERFINPDRLDLPDADLDFMSARRHEITSYLVDKYGVERVAAISNFGKLGAASAIRDVSRVFSLDEVDYRCSKFVPKEHGQPLSLLKSADAVPEIAEFRDKFAPIWKVSLGLEGVIRNMSQHAAGVVVAGVDLTERSVVEDRTGERVINWDKRIVEDQGLIKMDILGLNTLDLIDLTLKYIRERHSKTVNLMKVSLTDQKVLDMFAAGQTIGVFQFESGGMRRLLKDLGADGTLCFDDIVAATALYRPGPMDSGMMASYVKRKQGRETVEFDHSTMADVLAPTFGVMVYQEQVMKVAQVTAGYTLPQADGLRKIMGKKLPEEMKKERSKFVDGCVGLGTLDEFNAGLLFDKIEKFAGYGFNKSHSCEYSLISWWSMWLKTNYPVEFYASALTLLAEDKLPAILLDADRQGITVDTPDVNISTDRFEIVTDTRLSIPFSRVKGISTATAKMIVDTRAGKPFTSIDDFSARVVRRQCNIARIRDLTTIGAFARLDPTGLPAKHPDRIKEQRDLIPGLIIDTVPINRDMKATRDDKMALMEVVCEYKLNHGIDPDDGVGTNDGVPVGPSLGSQASFMVIFDQPSNSEEAAGKMASGDGFAWQSACKALHEAGFGAKDAYWTALIKRPKEGKQITPKEIATYAPYLDREIAILKPPVILLLGSTTVRHFIKDFAGKASEAAGTVVYSPTLDANFVIGFSPGEIYFDPDKQILLDDVFAKVASLLM